MNESAAPKKVVGRYAVHEEIASGGMATVHFGRLLGPVGFARTVAIKRLHPQFAKDPEFVSMFLDEARLAARIRHPNVVQTLDVVATDGELFLVMDYIQGESLSRLMRTARAQGTTIPPRIISAILSGTLAGLHAAHEAKSERGEPLKIVHRDVSPQNILVGQDGIARVLDFGVAKAVGRMQTTVKGQIKGKLSYMSPEQLHGQATRRSDVFAAAIVLWEVLAGRKLFTGENEGELLYQVLSAPIQKPASLGKFEEIVMRGLEREPEKRFATAREMAIAIERAEPPASAHEISEWVEEMARAALTTRAQKIAEIESGSIPGRIVDAGSAPPSEPERAFDVDVATVAAKVMPGPPPRSRAWIAIPALVAAGALGVLLLRREPAPVAPTPVVTASAPTFAPAAVTPSPSVSSVAPPSASPSVSAVASAPPKPKHFVRPAAAPVCDPPYTLDAAGRKKWKPECVGN